MSLVNAAHGRSEDTSAVHPTGKRPHGDRRSFRRVVGAYAALAKPRVIELLLVTTIPAMFLAGRQIPSPWLVLATLVGGTMAAGSANALNCVIDADIDKVMNRTKRRPLVRDSVPRRGALIFGIVLGIASFAVLYLTVNLLSAVLAVATILFYIFVYTLGLKRRTSQNVVWGGAAGCMPVVIGWAAVSGTVQWPAFVMFGVIFFWTPPHFWSLAQVIKSDYARARIPMLPVVSGERSAKRQSAVYALATAIVSVVPFFTGSAGTVYLAGAAVLGCGLFGITLLDLTSGRRWTRRVFAYSIVYVAALFGLFAVSPFFP